MASGSSRAARSTSAPLRTYDVFLSFPGEHTRMKLESSMASGSSRAARSTLAPLRRYDVFLSFRGEDTRMGFVGHLHTALRQKGFLVFIDAEELERGEYISEKLLNAIQESEYAIVVISEKYAFSKWCLKELTEIVKCWRKGQLKILPVFYHVDPSDVRKQNGTFADVFAKHGEEY